jgi:hypothetical protein
MKRKIIFCLIIYLTLMPVVNYPSSQACDGLDFAKMAKSVQLFLERYYTDYREGNIDSLMGYYLKEMSVQKEESLRYASHDYKIDKIEIFSIELSSCGPLEVEVIVLEWFKPGPLFPCIRYLYKLRRVNENNWKIVERSVPDLVR